MNDLNFWSFYWPFLAALLTSTVILELIGFGLHRHLAKRQAKKYKEIEEKIAAGEIPPISPFDPMGRPLGFGFDSPLTKGTVATSGIHGQYL